MVRALRLFGLSAVRPAHAGLHSRPLGWLSRLKAGTRENGGAGKREKERGRRGDPPQAADAA